MTPGLPLTGRRAAAGGTGGQAVDLAEIRRSEEAINLLAARRTAGPELKADPALVLLGALIADVDTPGRRAEPGEPGLSDLRPAHGGPAHGRPAQVRPAWPGRAASQRAEAWEALAASPRGAAAWLRTAVAGGLVAGLASLASLIATGMLARLARVPARGGRWQPRHARPRSPR